MCHTNTHSITIMVSASPQHCCMGQHGSAWVSMLSASPRHCCMFTSFFALADAMLTAHWQERGAKLLRQGALCPLGRGLRRRATPLPLRLSTKRGKDSAGRLCDRFAATNSSTYMNLRPTHTHARTRTNHGTMRTAGNYGWTTGCSLFIAWDSGVAVAFVRRAQDGYAALPLY